jgi:hypothetical protein
MFGVADQGGTLQGLATIPEFIWELGLSFTRSPGNSGGVRSSTRTTAKFPVRGTPAVAHAY